MDFSGLRALGRLFHERKLLPRSRGNVSSEVLVKEDSEYAHQHSCCRLPRGRTPIQLLAASPRNLYSFQSPSSFWPVEPALVNTRSDTTMPRIKQDSFRLEALIRAKPETYYALCAPNLHASCLERPCAWTPCAAVRW